MQHLEAEIHEEFVDDQARLLSMLMQIRDLLVEKSEKLSILLETQLNPSPALRLEGTEQKKAQHLFVSQARKIEAELNKLTRLAENFRVHIY